METNLHGLEVSSESFDCCAVVTLNGELDVASGPDVDAQVNSLKDQGRSHLLFDCNDLDFIDSSGFHALMQAHETFEGRVALVAPPAGIQRLIEIVALGPQLPGFDTVELAQEFLHSGRQRSRAKA